MKETDSSPAVSGPGKAVVREPAVGSGRQSRPRRLAAAYRWCEALTEAVVYVMVIFNPWVFGTTQVWSTWVMNGAGYVLGLLLIAKCLLRWRTGYEPSRWEAGKSWTTVALAGLTVLLLGYCLLSALNAHGTFDLAQRSYAYIESFISWLPHSYDRASTWFVFWEYLGLALTFWATRDWLLGKTRRERQAELGPAARNAPGAPPPLPEQPRLLPDRLRRFLWVLCLNGAVLSLEGIIQRLDESNRLLWLVQPRINQQAESQFGPYAYRSNAAQYFNLVWPVCLGFWWTMRREMRQRRRITVRVGSGPHTVLLPGIVLMAACPVISTTRGGSIVSLAMFLVAMPTLLLAERRGHWLTRAGLVALGLAMVGLAVNLGWEPLVQRFKTVFSDHLSDREEIYQNAAQMVQDYPVYGTGPGTFATMYMWYRAKLDQKWLVQAHDDWLEIRATFGWVGFAMVLLAFAMPLAHWWAGQGIACPRVFVAMFWIALGGCLLHARFDFPLQIHSILSLFLWHCCVLSCVAKKGGATEHTR